MAARHLFAAVAACTAALATPASAWQEQPAAVTADSAQVPAPVAEQAPAPVADEARAATDQAPAPAGGVAPVTAYRINPGDDVEVFVWGEERLQRVIRVLPDGSFSFPLVGQINALNKLPSEIEDIISKGLVSQYKGDVPQVTVSVRAPSGLQFSVVGKVRSPGTFTPGRYVNVLEALSFAGGPSEFAQLGNIIVIRKDGDGLRSFRVRLSDTLKGAPTQEDLSTRGIPQVRSGDTVIVP